MLLILTSFSDEAEARSMAHGLVSQRLAGCVQILPKMTSVYSWEGSLQNESEHLLIIKTLPQKYEEVETYILDHHSYDTPEIVAINSEKVAGGYLKWLTDYL